MRTWRSRIGGWLLAAALCAAPWLAPAAAASEIPDLPPGKAARVTIAAQPSTAGGSILLKEIAVIEASDAALAQKLEELVVGVAALPGAVRYVSLGSLEMRMRQARLPVSAIAVQAESDVIGVVTRSQSLAADAIAEAVHAWYETALKAVDGAELRLTVDASPMEVPEGDVEIAVASASPRWGKSAVTLDIIVGGAFFRRVSVTVEAMVEQSVWVATRDLPRKAPLSAGDVVMERRVLSKPVDQFQAGEGFRVTGQVKAGAHLTPADVEPVPAIEKGSILPIVADTGAVVVRAVGESMAEGWVGDRVAVRNLSSGSVVYGTLTEDGYVAVQIW